MARLPLLCAGAGERARRFPAFFAEDDEVGTPVGCNGRANPPSAGPETASSPKDVVFADVAMGGQEQLRDGIGLVGPLVIPGVTSCLGKH